MAYLYDLPNYSCGIGKERVLNMSSVFSILECLICNKIVYEPEECIHCQKALCGPCAKKWAQQNMVCPNSCSRFSTRKAHRVTRNLLSKVQIKCTFCSQGCREVLCHDTMRSHEKECGYRPAYCKAYSDCGFHSTMNKIKKHEGKCTYVSLQCPTC